MGEYSEKFLAAVDACWKADFHREASAYSAALERTARMEPKMFADYELESFCIQDSGVTVDKFGHTEIKGETL